MVKLTFRIPSKAIQYGYVEMEVDLPNDPTPEDVATQYLDAVSRFQVTEMDIVKGKQAAPPAASKPVSEPPSEALDDGSDDIDEAAETIAEGLGGVTVVEDIEAPWEKAEPAAQANPWDEGPVFDWS